MKNEGISAASRFAGGQRTKIRKEYKYEGVSL
jgi:hypothetical protein